MVILVALWLFCSGIFTYMLAERILFWWLRLRAQIKNNNKDNSDTYNNTKNNPNPRVLVNPFQNYKKQRYGKYENNHKRNSLFVHTNGIIKRLATKCKRNLIKSLQSTVNSTPPHLVGECE